MIRRKACGLPSPRETAIGGESSNQIPAGHDAQRNLEQKALRNVRDLVDRLEAEERAKSQSQKWVAVVVVLLTAVAVVGAVGLANFNWKSGESKEIVIVPASKPPAR